MTLTRNFPPGCWRAVAGRFGSTVLACLAVAGVLWLMQPRPPGVLLAYSLCIGLSCHAFIEGGLQALSRWQQRGVPRERRVHWPRGPLQLVWVLAGTAAGLWLGGALANALTDQRPAWLLAGELRALAPTLALSLLASVVGTGWFYNRFKLAELASRAEAAQRAATEAQLKLLQAQLEPHMLFNTLANLRALIALDPPRAQAMLDHLIAFLRATLSASREPLQPLAAEFDRLQDYLSLMSCRMGPRLQTRLLLPDELRAHPVPPLLLQPLVENAIKHGLEPKLGGGRIEVEARRDGAGTLRLSVRDTGLGLRDEGPGPHFGNLQLCERLQALFGDAARFTLAPAGDAEGGALASITLPWSPTA